jgi:transcriptional regulator with XRE-family HTH domain
VSTELRRLRKEAGLTCADAAKALDVSITKISRMETGERGLYADEVAALLGLYRVPAKLRHELLDLVRNGHDPNWWQTSHGQLPAAWKDLIQLEADATEIANFEPILVPGLLQTAEYTSALFHGIDNSRPAAEVNALVATRMARQAVLTGQGATTLHAIVDEMVLRRPIGEPGVMRRQLGHLLSSTDRPNIQLQVIPVSAGASPALKGPLMIIDLPGSPRVLFYEANGAGVFFSEDQHLRPALLAWQRLRAIALSPLQTRSLIADIIGEMP